MRFDGGFSTRAWKSKFEGSFLAGQVDAFRRRFLDARRGQSVKKRLGATLSQIKNTLVHRTQRATIPTSARAESVSTYFCSAGPLKELRISMRPPVSSTARPWRERCRISWSDIDECSDGVRL